MSDRVTIGDMFRDEFRDVIGVAGRLPRGSVAIAPSSIPWAILAGLGAGFFVSAPVRVGASLLFSAPRRTEFQPPTSLELATIAATACALAVAWRAGGWLAAEGYLGFVALERLLTIPRLLRSCADPRLAGIGSPFADRCTLSGEMITLWPVALGCVLAFVIVRAFSRSGGATNGALEAAGALVLAQALWTPLGDLVLFQQPFTATPADVARVTAFGISQALIGGIVAGLVLARRGRWLWSGYAAIAAVVLLEYVWFSLRSLLYSLSQGIGADQLGGIVGLLAYTSPLVMLATAAVALATSRPRASAQA